MIPLHSRYNIHTISLALICLIANPLWSQITVEIGIPAYNILANFDAAVGGQTGDGYKRLSNDNDDGPNQTRTGQSFTLDATEEIHNVYFRMDGIDFNRFDGPVDLEIHSVPTVGGVPDLTIAPIHAQTASFPEEIEANDYFRFQLDTPRSLAAGSYAVLLVTPEREYNTDDPPVQTNSLNVYLDVNTDGTLLANGNRMDWNAADGVFGAGATDLVFALTGAAIPPLNLEVDRTTGAMTIQNANGAGVPLALDYYDVKSSSGSLDATAWTSLADQNLAADGFPAGDGTGNGWEEGGNNNANQLIESYLLGSSSLADAANISLGNAFDISGSGDLEFVYHEPGFGSPTIGTVSYIGEIDGDFDNDGSYTCSDIDQLMQSVMDGTNDANLDLTNDGMVDLLDRDAWLAEAGQARLASGNPYLLGDTDFDGSVTSIDLGVLLNNFGDTSGMAYCAGNFDGNADVNSTDLGVLLNNFGQQAASASAVPEPVSLLPLFFAIIGAVVFRRRQRAVNRA